MAGNGKNRKQAVRGRAGPPAWMLFVGGLVLGIAATCAVFLGGYAPTLRDPDGPTPKPDAEVAAPSDQGIAAKPEPRKQYDFYTVLPEMEVVIPDSKLSAKADEEAGATAPGDAASEGSSDTGRYVLQAASFSDPGEAEALKARLALMGFVAHVESVTINGQTWNRVRLGPYNSATKLEQAKQDLAANGINALALKVNN